MSFFTEVVTTREVKEVVGNCGYCGGTYPKSNFVDKTGKIVRKCEDCDLPLCMDGCSTIYYSDYYYLDNKDHYTTTIHKKCKKCEADHKQMEIIAKAEKINSEGKCSRCGVYCLPNPITCCDECICKLKYDPVIKRYCSMYCAHFADMFLVHTDSGDKFFCQKQRICNNQTITYKNVKYFLAKQYTYNGNIDNTKKVAERIPLLKEEEACCVCKSLTDGSNLVQNMCCSCGKSLHISYFCKSCNHKKETPSESYPSCTDPCCIAFVEDLWSANSIKNIVNVWKKCIKKYTSPTQVKTLEKRFNSSVVE